MIAARLALFYAIYFGATGIILPFWPTWLKAQGVDPTGIGIILAAATAARIFASPAFAHIADRNGQSKKLIIALSVGSTSIFMLFPWAISFWALLVLWVLFSIQWNPLLSLGESLTMLSAQTRRIEYGPIRFWGSLAFIVTSVGGGWVLEGRSENLIYALIMGSIAAMVIASLLLPNTRVYPNVSKRLPLRDVLANRQYLAIMIAGALIQSSHAVYYAFGTIHWRAAGHSEVLIGWLWAEGVIAETVLFLVGGTIRRYISPGILFAAAGAAALIRWTVLAETTDLTALLIVQVLHGLTFGATHLGIINFVSQQMPTALSATAISLYSAVIMGIASGSTMVAAGWMYENWAGGAYFAMAAMGAIGGVTGLVVACRGRRTTG
jgi:PPP family 3-phenylpropionic acid transporter